MAQSRKSPFAGWLLASCGGPVSMTPRWGTGPSDMGWCVRTCGPVGSTTRAGEAGTLGGVAVAVAE